MNYARIRTQIFQRPSGLTIYVRAPRRLRSGLGDSAPSSIDLTSLFNPSDMPQPTFEPTYYPTPAGNVIPSTSPLYPLTIAPPGMSQQSTLQAAAQTLASLISPKPQTPVAQAGAFGSSAGVTSWLSQNSGVAGLSNGVLVGGALGIGILFSLLGGRRR